MESRHFVIQETKTYTVEAEQEVEALAKVTSASKSSNGVEQIGCQYSIVEVEVEDDSQPGKMAKP
jgi:hypothetical protein